MAWTLVTGGAKGLGAEICRTLASQGHDILVHYWNSEKEALELVEKCKQNGVSADAIYGDFSSPEGVKKLLSTINKRSLDIKCLINSVGNFYQGSPLETPIEVWNELFQTNFHAPLLLIRGLIPNIKAHVGTVINLGSAGVKDMRADDKYTAYTISKKALYLLTISLAKELAKDGVRVNMVSPGVLENSVTLDDDIGRLPMGRAGTLQEVANAILFLLQPENKYITGQNIEVAGGFAL
jgi:NAD(P)-dependent dehydrogenase (short-subunit alcohol dehydrogenase family)